MRETILDIEAKRENEIDILNGAIGTAFQPTKDPICALRVSALDPVPIEKDQ